MVATARIAAVFNCLIVFARWRLHPIHGFLGQRESAPPNGISTGSSVFPQLTAMSNSQIHYKRRPQRDLSSDWSQPR